jgi:hypothetical protein
MGTLDELIFGARAMLVAQERREAAVLAARYARLATQLAATTSSLATAIAAAGKDAADPLWLERQALYAQLQRGTGYQMGQVGRFVTTRLANQQRTMIGRGEKGGVALLRALGAEAGGLDAHTTVAQERIAAARLAAYDLPRTLPALAVQIVKNAAAKVALLGLGVADVLARLREGFGGVLTKLLFLSRSEIVNPYRDATMAVFARNGVASWQWFAEIEQRPAPCGMCVALHGRTFPLSEAFATHHGCRCLPVPVLPNAPTPVLIGGQAWLASQDAAIQLQVLGPSKHAHYLSGALQLDALISDDVLPDGRRMRKETPLKNLGLERVRTPRPTAGAPA